MNKKQTVPFLRSTFAALLVLALGTATLAAQKISVETNPDADLSKYRSFGWVRVGTPNLMRGSLPEGALSDIEADTEIRYAIERGLIQKGFIPALGESDLLINYLGLVSYRILDWEKFRVNRRSNVEGTEPLIPYEHWKPMSEAAEEGYAQRQGSLTIDIVEAQTNRLLWRGVMKDVIIGQEKLSAPQLKELIDEAVAQILSELPPRKTGR